MNKAIRCMIAIGIAFISLFTAIALGDEAQEAAYTAVLSALRTPAEEGLESGTYSLHTGDYAYVPDVAPDITPYDEKENTVYPPVNGTFTSTDDTVVSVSETGLMYGAAEGQATIAYHTNTGEVISYSVTVSDSALPEKIKNYVYVLLKEFNTVKRSRLPKYNQYAKWYYGRKKEVGWCSVFTIYCANAAGNDTPKYKTVTQDNQTMVQFFSEGQVGNQYTGFDRLERFVGIPKTGYLVIYAEMKNAYRTTHIGSIVDAVDMGDGVYMLTTVEGNMSNTVKSYRYLYDSKKDNHLVGKEKGLKLQYNMEEVSEIYRDNPTIQYELHTDHWSVFGFCATW